MSARGRSYRPWSDGSTLSADTDYHHVVTSNVDAVYDGHVGNHARFVSHGVHLQFISFVVFPSGHLHVHLLPAFFGICVFIVLHLFVVAHYTRVAK